MAIVIGLYMGVRKNIFAVLIKEEVEQGQYKVLYVNSIFY